MPSIFNFELWYLPCHIDAMFFALEILRNLGGIHGGIVTFQFVGVGKQQRTTLPAWNPYENRAKDHGLNKALPEISATKAHRNLSRKD